MAGGREADRYQHTDRQTDRQTGEREEDTHSEIPQITHNKMCNEYTFQEALSYRNKKPKKA